jgi:hypothetical protein
MLKTFSRFYFLLIFWWDPVAINKFDDTDDVEQELKLVSNQLAKGIKSTFF